MLKCEIKTEIYYINELFHVSDKAVFLQGNVFKMRRFCQIKKNPGTNDLSFLVSKIFPKLQQMTARQQWG